MMTSRILGSSTGRPLFIDFNSYTDGDDDFKKELIDLIIDNLRELQQTVRLAAENNDAQLFHRVCHKVKATLQMLEDEELLATVDQLKVMISDPARIALLDKLCNDVVESLRRE